MIKEYKIHLYPRRMWVVRNESFDDIKNKFTLHPTDEKLTDDEIKNNYTAIVFHCSKDKFHGYMVFISDDCDDGCLVHEALHVAIGIYEDCSIDLKAGMDQEPLCYLTEYVYRLIKGEYD